jgi:hypothetical protein
MIVVVGIPAWDAGEDGRPAGRACDLAIAAATAGSAVELVGRAGDDDAGDALVLALANAGVGHVALLRDPGRPTYQDGADGVAPELEPADVELGLRYLSGFEVLVVSDDAPQAVLRACLEGASFAGAHLVIAVAPGREAPADLPPDATVLVAPADDDGSFGRLLGRYAAGLDQGDPPAAAFAAATADGWERVDPRG